VNAINPQNYRSTTQLQQFVVTADVSSDGAGAATIPIYPPLITSGAYQTVDASPASGATINVLGAANTVTPQGLGFHPSAFVMASANLIMPNQGKAKRVRMKDIGMALRYWEGSDIMTDQHPSRLDGIYGFKTQRPEFAVRFASVKERRKTWQTDTTTVGGDGHQRSDGAPRVAGRRRGRHPGCRSTASSMKSCRSAGLVGDIAAGRCCAGRNGTYNVGASDRLRSRCWANPSTSVSAGDFGSRSPGSGSRDQAGRERRRAARVRRRPARSRCRRSGNDMQADLNGTTILAMTLANPSDRAGRRGCSFPATGKAAHTVTYTAGLGNVGATADVLTFNADQAQTVELVASGGFWQNTSIVAGAATLAGPGAA
jgi:hypothetical protein